MTIWPYYVENWCVIKWFSLLDQLLHVNVIDPMKVYLCVVIILEIDSFASLILHITGVHHSLLFHLSKSEFILSSKCYSDFIKVPITKDIYMYVGQSHWTHAVILHRCYCQPEYNSTTDFHLSIVVILINDVHCVSQNWFSFWHYFRPWFSYGFVPQTDLQI